MKRLSALLLTLCLLCTLGTGCMDLFLGEYSQTTGEVTNDLPETVQPVTTDPLPAETPPAVTTAPRPAETTPPVTTAPRPAETTPPVTTAPRPAETTPPVTTAPRPAETTPPVTTAPRPTETTPPVTTAPRPAETTPPVTTAPITTAGTDREPEPSTFSIHFIDVGQADAALVECDGLYMLIDGGNKADSDRIYSVLKQAGAKRLELVVGTHAHEDHIGGIPGAFAFAEAAVTLCSADFYDSDAFADFKKSAERKGGGITVPAAGDTYRLGSALVTILGVGAGQDANNSSIILKITYGDTSFLFTGDAEREAEQAVLQSGADLSADVLKVGHHGSDTSTTYPFLREIMPEYAIISAGEGNAYGHPTENTLSRLRDAEVKVFRTDLQGDIFVSSDGTAVTVSVERGKDADTLQPPAAVTEPAQTTPAEPEETEAGEEYVLNTSTKKFHYPSCSSVKRMSDKNKAFFTGTREELIADGYEPCGNCHP